MRIGFDIDGVLADFNKSFIELVIEITGEDKFPPRPFAIPTWHYPQHYGYSDEAMDFVNGPVWNAVRTAETFWADLDSYEWTHDVLDDLMSLRHHGHDIYFITDRPGVRAKEQTEHWLHWKGFDEPTVLISGAKGLVAQALNLDAYVDDRAENVDKVAAASFTTRAFLLNRPWNASYGAGYVRIAEPAEMFKALAL
jgi:FMN phosphatase YigB (HAD superfamily)